MSKSGTKLILKLNNSFKKPIHPFNLENEGVKNYSEWEYENAHRALSSFSPEYSQYDILKDKTVLDLGCGGGGKSIFYAESGADHVYGLDINEEFTQKAVKFAEEKNLTSKTTFSVGNACDMPYEDDSFDTIIMNDFFEHVSEPEKALKECFRVLKSGGKIFINFPPYSHPWGEHLNDAINIPWVHVFFSEDSMINAYLELIKDKPDYESRKNLRFSSDESGRLHNTYINKMTKHKADSVLSEYKSCIECKKYLPLRESVSFITKTTGLLTGMCVYVLRKE